MIVISTRIEGNFYIINLAGEFDNHACKVVSETFEMGSKSFCNHVLVDLSNLNSITTAGQRILLTYLSRLHHLEMMLVVYQLQPAVYASLTESGLGKLINIVPTLQEAKLLATSSTIKPG